MQGYCSGHTFKNFAMSLFKAKDCPGLHFLRDSTVHGVKYLAQRQRPITERITWICILLCSLAASGYFMYGIIQKYIHNPIIVSFQPSQTSVSDVPFASVTICSSNRLKKRAIHEFFRRAQSDNNATASRAQLVLRQLDHVCSLSNTFSNYFNYSINETRINVCSRFGVGCGNDNSSGFRTDYLKEISGDVMISMFTAVPNCPEIISLCLWEGRRKDCGEIFHTIITDMGFCCVFNAPPRPYVVKDFANLFGTRPLGKEEHEFWKTFNFDKLLESNRNKDGEYEKFLKFQSKAGQGSGLSVLINTDLDEYFCDNHDSYGIRIHTHSPIEIPHVAEYGVSIGPNVEMFMSLKPEITKSDRGIRDLRVSRRNCYYTTEQNLDSYHFYTKSNCLDQCLGEEIAGECNCIRMDMGVVFTKPSLANITYCEGIGLACAKRALIKLGKMGLDHICPECRPSCNQIEYVSHLSSLPLKKNFTIKVQQSEEDEGNGPDNFVRPNASIVHIFFGSDNVYSKIRKNLYSVNDLFAHVGGILGLFLGMSVVSVVEPVNIFFRKYFSSKTEPAAKVEKDFKAKYPITLANYNNSVADSWRRKFSSYLRPDARIYPFQH